MRLQNAAAMAGLSQGEYIERLFGSVVDRNHRPLGEPQWKQIPFQRRSQSGELESVGVAFVGTPLAHLVSDGWKVQHIFAPDNRNVMEIVLSRGGPTAETTQTDDGSLTQLAVYHRESLAPLVVVDASCKRKGTQLTFAGLIRNIGLGPATSIYVAIKPHSGMAAQKHLGGLGAGDVWEIDLHWEVGDLLQSLEFFPYDCQVISGSMFGSESYVLQYSHSGKAEDATIREVISSERAKRGEINVIKAGFTSLPPVPAFGDMHPRGPQL